VKGTLIFLLVLFTALILIGCSPTLPSTDVDEQLKITGFEQEVSCGSKSFSILNGDRCCPECEICEECPEPEDCPSCNCKLKWGDLYIYFNECCEEVCVLITYEDWTTVEECFCVDSNGEAKVILSKRIQVIFVELI